VEAAGQVLRQLDAVDARDQVATGEPLVELRECLVATSGSGDRADVFGVGGQRREEGRRRLAAGERGAAGAERIGPARGGRRSAAPGTGRVTRRACG
jgi:hypothetical protein